MTNNDVLRRLRYVFDFSDNEMIEIFGLADYETTRAEVSNWLKRDDDENYVHIIDRELAIFLNGLIVRNRGKQDNKPLVPEKRLNNNIIFRKLRIALELKDEDILKILKSVDFELSKHELSAFFRKPGQKQYRECQAQVLRKFFQGLQQKYREN